MIAMPRHGAVAGAGRRLRRQAPGRGRLLGFAGEVHKKIVALRRPGHIGRPGDSAAPPQGGHGAGRARPSPVRRSGRVLRGGGTRGPAGPGGGAIRDVVQNHMLQVLATAKGHLGPEARPTGGCRERDTWHDPA